MKQPSAEQLNISTLLKQEGGQRGSPYVPLISVVTAVILSSLSVSAYATEPNNPTTFNNDTHIASKNFASNFNIISSPFFSLQTNGGIARHNAYCRGDIEKRTAHPKHINSNNVLYDIDCMMTTLKDYQDSALPTTKSMDATLSNLVPYYAYKAQAWLNYAYHEEREGSLTQAGNIALAEGAAILQALETNATDTLLMTSDIPSTSAMMRPDLWAVLMALKSYKGAVIAPRELAFSEVKLIWAASEYCEFGWRHATEHFGAAERAVNEARQAVVNTLLSEQAVHLEEHSAALYDIYKNFDPTDDVCRGQIIPPIKHNKIIPTVDESVPVPMPDVSISYSVEPIAPLPIAIELKSYIVHFALDKSNLSPQSQDILNTLITDIEALPDDINLSSLTFDLYGHTDKRASYEYNLKLSGRRTQSVADYLMSQGVPSNHIYQHPEGQTSLVKQGSKVTDHALNRRVEVVVTPIKPLLNNLPDDVVINRVGKETLNNTSDYQDLQLEK